MKLLESKKNELINKIKDIKSNFNFLLPDDDFFWENHREDVNEVKNDLDELIKNIKDL
jgi:hypothetical protein